MPCTANCTRFSASPNAIMRSKPKASHWNATSTSERTLVIATARVGAMRQSRSSVAKPANISPAVTKDRSPTRPCVPIVASASAPMMASPATMTAAPAARCAGSFSLEHPRGRHKPARRGEEGLDPAAMGERHKQEPGIAQECEGGPADERQRPPLGPAHTAEIAQARTGDERQEGEPRPDE